jgi:hypothetical protein
VKSLACLIIPTVSRNVRIVAQTGQLTGSMAVTAAKIQLPQEVALTTDGGLRVMKCVSLPTAAKMRLKGW